MAGRRHLSRVLALQVLYAYEYLEEEPSDLVRRLTETGEVSAKNWTPFCRQLVANAIERVEDLDGEIGKALKNWRLERLSLMDRLVLRLALCEMRTCDDIPIRVTMNEYIDLAKQFSTDDSSSFVNGVLDHLAQEFTQKDFQSQNPKGKPRKK